MGEPLETEGAKLVGAVDGEQGWVQVRGRHRMEKENRVIVDRLNEEGFVSFYVTNLPDGCRKEWLADAVSEFGCLADSFVAKKRNKAGNVFGFVKFRNVKDKRALECKLKGVTIGVMKARVNLQKFNRQGRPVKMGEYTHVPIFSRNMSEDKTSISSGGEFRLVNLSLMWLLESMASRMRIKGWF
ncbi:hypothetical protein SSX86_022696 [Deinandra increscens subsp. villosa]|uniref:RRM domain-containing protein n=1 Tax=Deinandra increscens subsp. villosa TaxID=3103831 RepID=A0AAP0CPF5_9ASTR